MDTTTRRPAVIALDGDAPDDRELLGGKAASVNRMRRIGLPVPPAFALPTYVCGDYHANGRKLPDDAWEAVVSALAALERDSGRTFGAGPSPLLVSVRSGAAQSMPGMMDTVLNLGLTPPLVEALADESGDPAWARDTWARFGRSYGEIVLGEAAAAPPDDAHEQLRAAIGAVFDSWTNERVRTYRERHGLGAGAGTAVTVQAMVFGNRDGRSGTGVLFSRNPNTGSPGLYGEWLTSAQGEDVVSGEATPKPLDTVAAVADGAYAELERIAAVLEREHGDMVDVEFTLQSGQLYILQSRAGKRSAQAAVTIAVDLLRDGIITAEQALARVTAEHVDALAGARLIDGDGTVLARGLGACPGVAQGTVAGDLEAVLALEAEGRQAVLARTFTAPDDVPAMFQSVGVITEVGGATSHAALVCREIGLPCVVGAGEGVVARLVGRDVTIDGSTGTVYGGDDISVTAAGSHPSVHELAELARVRGETGHPILALTGGP